MEKRLPLAQSADPHVSAEAVEAMKQQKYLALVQPKIQETCYTPGWLITVSQGCVVISCDAQLLNNSEDLCTASFI